MHITEISLDQLSKLHYKFFTCPLENAPYRKALIVAFDGEYGYGSKGNSDAAFMSSMIKAGLEAWGPAALIIDLRAMSYEWGDMIGSAIAAGADRNIDSPFPTAIVVSDRNREGMTSFVQREMGQEPGKWLFETLEDALRAVAEQLTTILVRRRAA